MKALVASLVLVVFLTACGHDGKLRRQLIGTWAPDKIIMDGTESQDESGEIVLSFDNHWESKITATGKLYTNSFAYAGTWRIAEKELIFTYTNTSNSNSPVGTVDRFKIIRVNATELVLKIEQGQPQTIFYKRIR